MTAQITETDVWGIDGLDVDEYLRRIGQPRAGASRETLESLHEAHVRAIPFENVDVLLGVHPGLRLDVIAAKLVGRDRGGYCFEHATLLAGVLERLGFTVERRLARVQPERPGPLTHMMLVVRIDGAEFLADVGYGSGLMRPMPLLDGLVLDQAGFAHRVTRRGRWWRLEKRVAEGWEAQYEFDDTPRYPVDYEVSHHYTSTSPRSPFLARLIVMRLETGVSHQLIGDELIATYADGHEERTTVPAERLGAKLREFGIGLTGEELSKLLAIKQSGVEGLP